MSEHPGALLYRYFRQQSELSVPDHIFSRPIDLTAPATAPTAGEFGRNQTRQPGIQVPSPAAPRLPAEAPAAQSPESVREKLVHLYQEVKTCDRCTLCRNRTKFVFGSGNAQAPTMVIGDAPGAEEDFQGLPFVGPAGQLLTKMLLAVNINRSTDVFITNVLKCRPPDGRPPDDAEVVACIPILKDQISIIAPKAILLLGSCAARAVLDIKEDVAGLRGTVHRVGGCVAIVTHHPAELLRKPELKRQAWADLQKFRDLLTEIGVHGTT